MTPWFIGGEVSDEMYNAAEDEDIQTEWSAQSQLISGKI